MLYMRDSFFIDVVFEPQFQLSPVSPRLCSVRTNNLEALLRMQNSVRGEVDVQESDRVYPFTGFAYEDDLCRELKTKSLSHWIDESPNFSSQAQAFEYLAFESNATGDLGAGVHQGILSPEEVSERIEDHSQFSYFRVWPVFSSYRLRDERQARG